MPDQTRRTLRLGPILVISLLILIAAGTWLIVHLITVKTPELIHDLSSPDPEVVHDSLIVLKDRHESSGIDKAILLLDDSGPDVEEAAAIYLAAFDKPEAVPQLIRALKSPDDPNRREILSDLTRLTGKSFGQKYEDWKTWYLQAHPESAFTFQ